MPELAIDIKNVSKLYKLYEKPIDRLKELIHFPSKKNNSTNFMALNKITVQISKGETIGILGKNGAGKSTLLKIITGVLSQTSGEIKIDGTISALLELGAGFNPEYSGIDNIFLNGAMMGFKREEMEKKLDHIVSFADIGEFINQPVKCYSSGMFARLAFSVAISVEPDILIVDEALSVGDTRFQIKCMEYMKKMMEGGTTVLFVSHDINAIRRFCHRCIWLDKGEIILDGDVNNVADAYSDFLKRDYSDALDYKEKGTDGRTQVTIEKNLSVGNINCIAEIVNFKVIDTNGRCVGENIKYDEPLIIYVDYMVYDESLINSVIGIAIRASDDDYICGLNTLLDEFKVPWKKGLNSVALHFPYGIRAAGGDYFFEVAIQDQTATVGIHYIQRIQKFHMEMEYKCEGRYSIPHHWEDINK